jgi:predicted porin
MNQKLIAAAVAGAFALPGVALAQVTISGTFELGLSQAKVSDAPVRTAAGFNTSSNIMRNAANLRFGMTEDLGGGTSFFGLYEIRPILDGGTATADALAVGSATPQAYLGLRNAAWGSVRAGNISIWSGRGDAASGGPKAFNHGADNLTSYGATTVAAAGSVTSLIAGRQRNSVYYESPKMGGFTVNLGYSTSPQGNDDELTNASRKGSGQYFSPEYDAGFVKVGWMNAKNKADAATSLYKGNKYYATGMIGPIKAGFTYVTFKGETAAGLNNLNNAGWYIPLSYATGAHNFGIIIGKAGDNKNVVGDQSAKQTSMAYNYSLSKRTWLSLSHVKLKNATGGSYDLSNHTGTMDGATGFTSALGEDLTSTTFGLHHTF